MAKAGAKRSASPEVPRMTAMDKKYQAQDDARTMQRTGEIMADTKRHAAARREMEAQKKAMEKAMKMKG